MRRWYASALQRIAYEFDGCESGWDLLFKLAENRPCDLVVASRSLPGLSGAQVLAMLRTADSQVPFVLVAPFCDGGVRSLVARLRNAVLVEDSLDGVGLAETAEALLVKAGPPRQGSPEKVRRAALLCARAGRLHAMKALG